MLIKWASMSITHWGMHNKTDGKLYWFLSVSLFIFCLQTALCLPCNFFCNWWIYLKSGIHMPYDVKECHVFYVSGNCSTWVLGEILNFHLILCMCFQNVKFHSTPEPLLQELHKWHDDTSFLMGYLTYCPGLAKIVNFYFGLMLW